MQKIAEQIDLISFKLDIKTKKKLQKICGSRSMSVVLRQLVEDFIRDANRHKREERYVQVDSCLL